MVFRHTFAKFDNGDGVWNMLSKIRVVDEFEDCRFANVLVVLCKCQAKEYAWCIHQ